jgi:hypothetical protein
VLVLLNHVASFIVNANHSIMLEAAKLRVADCVADCVWPGIPKPTEWRRIGNQVDAAMVFARADFVNVSFCAYSLPAIQAARMRQRVMSGEFFAFTFIPLWDQSFD